MANQTLRELAGDHAQGNLDKETYRKARAKLIQGILSNVIPLKQIEYPPPVQPPEPESLDDTQRKDEIKKPSVQKARSETPDSSRSDMGDPTNNVAIVSAGKSSKTFFIGSAVVLVIIIVVTVIALGQSSSRETRTSTTASIDSAENMAPPAQITTQAQKLIRGFLNENSWSDPSLNYFLQQWAELPAGDILTSKESLEMGQLINAIYKQLLEEKALSELVDDDSSLNKQQQLLQFASELGIDDPRIALPAEEEEQTVEDLMENLEP